MSHLDELDDFEAELELRLKREYSAVYSLFRYCVLTQDATYLCNKLDFQYVDATNLSGAGASHMHSLVVTFQDADHFTQTWTHRVNGKDQTGVFEFTRKK